MLKKFIQTMKTFGRDGAKFTARIRFAQCRILLNLDTNLKILLSILPADHNNLQDRANLSYFEEVITGPAYIHNASPSSPPS